MPQLNPVNSRSYEKFAVSVDSSVMKKFNKFYKLVRQVYKKL